MTGTGSPLLLRIRSRKGLLRLQSLRSTSTLKELKDAISNLTDTDASLINILKDHPPKQLNCSNENVSLESLRISNGELLTVEECSGKLKSSNLGRSKSPAKAAQDEKKQSQTPSPDGVLLRKVVPADNSCLFTSVYFVMHNGVLNLDCNKSLRELIASTVKSDSVTFNEAILGKKNSDYCTWIKNSNNWGGSIEVMILSKHFKCEICVVDIRTARIDRFGEDCAYANRVFVIYDGIHFDPLYMQPFGQDPSNKTIKTKFPIEDESVMVQALEIANEARRANQYTDVANFKLRCLSCQKPLSGQQQAQEHAENTGHINFGEINS
jgi:ubiquitin thioesterase OTU1